MGSHTAPPHGEAQGSLLYRRSSWEPLWVLAEGKPAGRGRLEASKGASVAPQLSGFHPPQEAPPTGLEGRVGQYLPAGQESWYLCPTG